MSEARGRLHLWSGLIILGVYLAGAATSAGLFFWLRPHHGHHGPRGPGGPPLHELDLTAEQQDKARIILDRHHAEIEAMMKESFPKIRESRDRAFDEIRTLLTEDQQKRFDAKRAEIEKHGPGFPPMGPPPGHPPH